MQHNQPEIHSKPYKVEFLISTMYRTDLAFLNPMFKQLDLNDLNLLIINQTTKDRILSSQSDRIRVFNSFDRGLSKSRNLALQHTNADIAIIADDDIEYQSNTFRIIDKAYQMFPDAALISFQYLRENGQVGKIYQKESCYQNAKLHKQSLSSIEISCRPKLLRQYAVTFNTCFGLGARFACGEEQVLRDDIIRHGLKVAYVAEPLAKHFGETSTPLENSEAYTEAIVAQKYLQHKNLIYLWLIRYIWKLIARKVIAFSEIGKIWNYGNKAIRDYKANCK